MSTTQDVGIVTAYGFAVEGGFTGTLAEFEAKLAKLPSNVDTALEAETAAASSATAAASSASAAETSAKNAEAATRKISNALVAYGSKAFADLPTLSEVEVGAMYNISDNFVSTDDFEDGAGISYPSGTNVYKTANEKWGCLAPSGVNIIKITAATYEANKDYYDSLEDLILITDAGELQAENVDYDNTTSGLDVDNVQDALDTLNENLTKKNVAFASSVFYIAREELFKSGNVVIMAFNNLLNADISNGTVLATLPSGYEPSGYMTFPIFETSGHSLIGTVAIDANSANVTYYGTSFTSQSAWVACSGSWITA